MVIEKKVIQETKEKDSSQSPVPAGAGAHHRRRVMVGVVVSNKMQKTIVVRVEQRVRHPLYKKYVTRARRYKVHDEKNEAQIGDVVTLVETRPLSKEKRWALQSIIRRGARLGNQDLLEDQG